ncbi:YdhR family protein [Pseudonocardia sp. RS11V-5]|uniref:YdhR family protein n=1 Tax=Pseudonocardia terrae TaxID=2905831 RepID=UPI001E2CCA30|nr:YdhR family protein [Pseudonocardia terrae]MCE3553120.1 YdhR family protein [Pseudonocardia terrae]
METTRLLVTGALTAPTGLVGHWVSCDDGSRSLVFRETAVRGRNPADPVVLVVRFRLRWIGRRRWAHAVFRSTCPINTPLFAGSPGFVTKLWLTDPRTGVYRGLYEWDGAERAERYATQLARVLGLVAMRGSIAHTVVEGVDRTGYVDGGRPLPANARADRRAAS